MRKRGIIDFHHHILPDFYVEALAKVGITAGGGRKFPKWTPSSSIKIMDTCGIQTAITSIPSPGLPGMKARQAAEIARRCNEYSASMAKEYPSRFGSFAVLPMPFVDESLAEIKYALEELKLDGVVLLGSYENDYLGSERF